MGKEYYDRRKKAILFNIIVLLIFLILLGIINNLLHLNISIYFIVIGVVVNLFVNSIIPSPGYYINRLKFDNDSIQKKIKIVIVNLIQNLFIICLIINTFFPSSELLRKIIGPALLFIEFLNVLYLSFSREQTFFEKLFNVILIDF